MPLIGSQTPATNVLPSLKLLPLQGVGSLIEQAQVATLSGRCAGLVSDHDADLDSVLGAELEPCLRC